MLVVKTLPLVSVICYFAFKLSFVKVQTALIFSLADEIIDEEEFVLLFDTYL